MKHVYRYIFCEVWGKQIKQAGAVITTEYLKELWLQSTGGMCHSNIRCSVRFKHYCVLSVIVEIQWAGLFYDLQTGAMSVEVVVGDEMLPYHLLVGSKQNSLRLQ